MTEPEWTLPGARGETIRVSTHPPATGDARATVLLAHGFKGYKDYGFIPVLADRLAASAPAVVHRFNFSHSGIGDDPSTFQRPDLFEQDTWNRQVEDLEALMQRVSAGDAPSTAAAAPIVLMGHSRGGASCLLAAGRWFRDGASPLPAGVVTMAAPAETRRIVEDDLDALRRQGYTTTTSSRTGQELRIGATWLEEQEAAPQDHDLLALCARIGCPVLALHGEDDPTVPADDVGRIAEACPKGRARRIPGGDHVFNTPNPADPEATLSTPLAAVVSDAAAFLSEIIAEAQ